jgi:fibrillarin-like rRNA methylase
LFIGIRIVTEKPNNKGYFMSKKTKTQKKASTKKTKKGEEKSEPFFKIGTAEFSFWDVTKASLMVGVSTVAILKGTELAAEAYGDYKRKKEEEDLAL